ncbi:MAG: right-handed parallel beta-helix repeat-containing protein [Verrucomicrobiota bacterium]
MKKLILINGVAVLTILFSSLVFMVYGVGSLDPESDPAPTFKTLNEIEARTIIDSIPFTITNSGSYYLTGNLRHSTPGADGIVIDAHEVTLDLNGFTLYGGRITGTNSRDGIRVSGLRTNLHIHNGNVIGWGEDGINAIDAHLSIFEELRVSKNNEDGLVTDNNCIIVRCVAHKNGFDGLEGNDNSIFKHCTANGNGDNGIQSSMSTMVLDCSSQSNGNDGIEVNEASVISRCVAQNNGLFGFDLATGSLITDSAARNNTSNGFDLVGNTRMENCVSSQNQGNGVRTFSNTVILDSQFFDNSNSGILISSSDCRVEGNSVTDNDKTGIHVTSAGNLIIRNRAAGNLTNYNIRADSAFGPIIDASAGGDLSTIGNADHPMAIYAF